MNWTVTNQGTGSTTSPTWTDKIYLSDDTAFGNDIFLGSFAYVGQLAPATSYTRHELVTIPISASGTRFH